MPELNEFEKKDVKPEVEQVIDWNEFWDGVKEVETEKIPPGTRVDGVVINIRKGLIKDLLPDGVADKWDNADSEAIEVEVEYEYKGRNYTKRKLMSLPQSFLQNKEVSKKANISKWKKSYGDYPKIGQKVFLIADGDGYFQFML